MAKRHNMKEVPGELHDPCLTSRGEQDANDAAVKASNLPSPELLVTSPMRRAVQTMFTAFAPAVDAGVPAVAHELCREAFHGLDPSIYDSRLSRDALAKAFPRVDFSRFVLPSEASLDTAGGTVVIDDPLWWHCTSPFGHCEGGIHEAAIVEHAYQFLCWLMSRPEQVIAVATHSNFLLALYHGCLSVAGGGAHAEPQVFHTGELRAVALVERSAHAVHEPKERLQTSARLREWGGMLSGSGTC